MRKTNIKYLVVLYFLCFVNISLSARQDVLETKKVAMIDSLNILSRDNSFVDNNKALDFAKEALKLSLSNGYKKGQAFAYRNMSSIYSSQESYAESIEYIKKAMDIFGELGDAEGIANCNISLGHTFERLGDFSLAYDYHKMAYDFFKQSIDLNRKAITTHNLAKAHYELTQLDSAEKQFKEALILSDQTNNQSLKSSCLSYLGEIEYYDGDLDTAQIFFEQSRAIFYELGPDAQKYATMSSFYHLSMIYKVEGDLDQMIQMLELATKTITEYSFPYLIDEVYKAIINFYLDKEDVEKVKTYTFEYATILEDLNKNNSIDKKRIALNLIQSKDLERSYEKRIRESEVNEEIVKANKIVINGLIFTSTILAILLIIVIYQFIRNRKNSNAIRSIFDNAKTAIILINDHAEIIRWNVATEKLFNESSDNFIGKNFFKEFVSVDSTLSPKDMVNSLFNEFTIKIRNGVKKDVSINCSKTYIDGKPFYVFLVIDQTEFNRLQRLNDFYRVIIEKSNEIAKIGTWEICYVDFLNKKFPIFSKQVLEIFELEHLSEEEMKDITWESFFKSQEMIDRIVNSFEEAIKKKKPFDVDLNLSSYKGKEVWIRFIGSVEYYSNADMKLFGTVQDITDLKKGIRLIEENLVREQELNKLKSRFISMASHEFRTPLATIITSVELIQMNLSKLAIPNTEIINKHTVSIFNQIDRLEKTLEGILMLEKSIQGKIEAVFIELDLVQLLNKIVDDTMIVGDDRRPILMIQSNIVGFKSDANLLYHVLGNLVSNSLKYSKGKERPVINLFQEESIVIIEIQDFGIGIPESDMSGLFSSFYRAKNTSGIKGTGLGLSIVKEFVSLIGADIQIDSKEGEGTKVTLKLPLETKKIE